MNKLDLLDELRRKMDEMELSMFTTLAYLHEIDYCCIIYTPIYTISIDSIDQNVCYEINKLYKNMTCKNIISEKMTYKELKEKFKEIYVDIVFE